MYFLTHIKPQDNSSGFKTQGDLINKLYVLNELVSFKQLKKVMENILITKLFTKGHSE